MSTDAVANLARNVWNDLREKRLWPLAAALLVAIIGIPLLLLHSSPPAAGPALAAANGAAPPGVPAVAAASSPEQAKLLGRGHDPFGQSGGTGTTGGGTAGQASTAGTTSTSGKAGGTSSATSAGSGSSSPTTPTATNPGSVVTTPAPAGGAPPPPTPANKPSPPTSGLSDTQSYGVSISMTDAPNGVAAMDRVERLTPLPTSQQPLIVELGVLQGGHRVLYAVTPGTVLRGPGICVPGPIDCEVMSLAPDQIESVSTSASTAPVAMFMVTDITAVNHGSQSGAQQARQTVSAAGRQFLAQVTLPAVQLFPYDADLGALIDVRNVTVGG